MTTKLVLLLALASAAGAQNYSISTVAGGVPIAGTSIPTYELNHARYVVLTQACQIWVVSSTGTLSEVIGNGACGFSGDNGRAASAQLYFPKSVMADNNGDLYITEEGTQRIRRVSGGTITSLPDGAGLPQGLAASGNVFLADLTSHRASRTSGRDGSVATSTPLTSPGGATVDRSGNLFIADTMACVVRKVAADTGALSTVAGNGACGYNGDGISATAAQLNLPRALAVDDSGNLYISDSANHRIRQVSGGTMTTVAGTGTAGYNGDNITADSAQLVNPQGVAVDGSGDLYIAEGSRIRKVSKGIISTVAGTGTSGYNGDNMPAVFAELSAPSGVAVDNSGNLYIADKVNQRIRKVSGGIITTVAGVGTPGYNGDAISAALAQVNYPAGVTVDSSGNLYIADGGNSRVRKVNGGKITTVAGNGVSGFDGDGGSAENALLAVPVGLAVDGSGNIYVADRPNNRIRKLKPSDLVNSAVSLVALPNPAAFGQNVTLTATLSPSTATGVVTFKDGVTTIGMGNVNNGTATLTLATLTAGAHFLTAVYGGDANDTGSSSIVYTEMIGPTGSSTSLSSSITTAIYSQPVSFTATVMPLTATGSVTFNDGATSLGTVALTNGTATLVSSTLLLGNHPVTAVYSGDANYMGSSSLVYNQTIQMAAKVGVFRGNAAFLEDTNGNGVYDPGVDRFIPSFTGPGGFVAGDMVVTADWTGDGHAKAGIYRSTTGQWFLDANNNGVFDAGDFTYGFGGIKGDVPVVGDWTGIGKSCIGVFRLGFYWVLDTDCNGAFSATDAAFPFGGLSGDIPVVGSWAGGATRVGVIRVYSPGGVPQGSPFYWVPDSGAATAGSFPADHQPDLTRTFAFGGLPGDVFVTGDWYGTGISAAAVYRNGLWVLDAALPGAPQANHVPGLTFGYGGVAGDVPVTGKW